MTLPIGIVTTEQADEATAAGIIIRCFTPVGAIPGMGKIEIDAKEFINLESQNIQQFVGIEVTPSKEYAPSGTAAIQYDDVDKVVIAIDRLAGINPASTKYKQIEAQFSLNSDFKIVVFNDAKGKLMFSVSAQTASAYFGDLLRMADLRSLILRARSIIDQNRAHRHS